MELCALTECFDRSSGCQPCRDDVTRVLANPAYIPTCRWRKERVESSNSYSCIKTCNNLSFSQTTTYDKPKSVHVHHIEFETERIPIPTPLCNNHYYVGYDARQSQRKQCIICSRRLWLGYDRPCPQPHVIQMHLSTH